MKAIKDLRKVLAAAILEVHEGTLAIDKANTMTKLASQINESIYAELKAKIVMKDIGEESSKLGSLEI